MRAALFVTLALAACRSDGVDPVDAEAVPRVRLATFNVTSEFALAPR